MEPTPYQRLRAEVTAALDAQGLSGKGGRALGLKAALVLLNWGFWFASIVRRRATAHGVTYHEFPTIAAAIRGHVRHLAHLGRARIAAAQAA